MVEIRTHSTDLKNRLTAFAKQYPDHCELTDEDDETGYKIIIVKGRLGFKLTPPYSNERRKAASEYAKKNGIAASKANK